MARHLMIAALCLETSLLAGGAVVIGQLWVRSNESEERSAEYRSELLDAENRVDQLERHIAAADADVTEFAGKLTSAEAELQQQQIQLAEYRTSVTTLEAQNEALLETADQAVQLSDEVAELKAQIAKGAASVSKNEQLVQVKRPADDAETEDKLVPFDDTGWRSIYPEE